MANNYYTFPVNFVPGTKVRSDEMNNELSGIEAGFDLLPTDPTSINKGTTYFGADSGAANAYVVARTNPQTSYTDGQRVGFFASHSNTSSATIDIDGLGVIALVAPDGAALVANDVLVGTYIEGVYDLSNNHCQLITPAAGTITQADLRVTWASEWANKAEDSLVSTAAGGDGVDDYSALHWANKASASAAAASTSETNAAASYDEFDDRYLGSKASDPALDNDGDALLEGALYWKSTATKGMRAYNGSAWEDVNQDAYTKTELDGGQLDNRYYTEAELDGGQLDNRYYTEAELDGGQLDNRYYTEAEADANFAPIERSRRNIMINGGMQIWQRETTFTAVAQGDYTADRWEIAKNSSAVMDVTRQVSTNDLPFYEYWSGTVTTADVAMAAGDFMGVIYNMEGNDIKHTHVGQAHAKTVTLSFWTAHTATGTYNVGIRNSAGNRSYVVEYTQTVADTWEKQTATLTLATDGTWNFDASLGMTLFFTFATGSSFHATADTWVTSNSFGTSGAVNMLDTVSNVFRFGGVKLELGNESTDFVQRTFNEELALCQRYYCKSYEYGDHAGDAVSTGALSFTSPRAATQMYAPFKDFPVTMRATPTVSVWGTDGVASRVNGIDSGDLVYSSMGRSDSSMYILTTTAATVQHDRYRLQWIAEADF